MLSANELNDLRQAVLRGENIPREKYKQIIESLRTKRAEDIAIASAKKERAEKKKKETTDEELANLLGL